MLLQHLPEPKEVVDNQEAAYPDFGLGQIKRFWVMLLIDIDKNDVEGFVDFLEDVERISNMKSRFVG